MRHSRCDAADRQVLVAKLFASRASIRAYRPDPIPRAVIERLLQLANSAPSNHNLQPWKVHVVAGAVRQQLTENLVACFRSGYQFEPEVPYVPVTLPQPYLGRKRRIGWQLYAAAGIDRGDREAEIVQHLRNFDFFGAGCALIFTLPRDFGAGAWLDLGGFLHGLMLAASAEGLGSCAQGIFAGYPAIVRAALDLPDDELVCCGMAIGYADMDVPTARIRSERAPVDSFTRFYD